MKDDLNLMDAANEEDGLIILIDEEGNEMNFLILDAVEIEELGQYVLVTPADTFVPEDEENDEETEQEVMILKVIMGETEDTFVSIEDDEEMEQVFEEFKRRDEECAEDEEE